MHPSVVVCGTRDTVILSESANQELCVRGRKYTPWEHPAPITQELEALGATLLRNHADTLAFIAWFEGP